MRCAHPSLISVDRNRHIYVPCRRCAWCRAQIRNEWFVRLYEESKCHTYTRFVTLDYDDEHLHYSVDEATGSMVPSVSLLDVQNYHKKIRKMFRFRFFLVSEYGRLNGRPHYHSIYYSDEMIPFLDLWPHGQHGADLPAEPSSYKYVTKYMLKGAYVPQGAAPLIHTMSRRPGIGAAFIQHVNDSTLTYNMFGKRYKLPAYYSRKFLESLSDELRASLSESKLDYLSHKGRYADLESAYLSNAPAGQSIDDFVRDMEKKDYYKQLQINKL